MTDLNGSPISRPNSDTSMPFRAARRDIRENPVSRKFKETVSGRRLVNWRSGALGEYNSSK